MRVAIIYGLFNDSDETIRYVGKTEQTLDLRLKGHLKESKIEDRTHKQKWINKTLRTGGCIKIKELERVPLDVWPEKETFWVNFFKETNNLTNTAEPGKGGSEKKFTITYKEASKRAQELDIKTRKEWIGYTGDRNGVPISPNKVFQDNGWIDWNHFLRGNKKRYWCFNRSKKYVKTLSLKNVKEWSKFCVSGDKPFEIPSAPDKYYKEWISWDDFLNVKNIKSYKKINPLNFEDLKKLVKELGLKNRREWREYCNSNKRDSLISSHPELCYKEEWKGWGDFFGTNVISNVEKNKSFLNLGELKCYIKKEKINNRSKWNELILPKNRPNFIPTNPDKTYKNKGWTTWGDFFNFTN